MTRYLAMAFVLVPGLLGQVNESAQSYAIMVLLAFLLGEGADFLVRRFCR